METPTLDTTPALARPRTSPLAPQRPPSPGTPGTPSTPIARPARSGKARDLLRQHYGMNIGPQAPLPGRPNDPMNIGWCPCPPGSASRVFTTCILTTRTPLSFARADSTSFDAKAYYEQLITTSSLTGLLKRENELSAGLCPPLLRLPLYIYIPSDFCFLVFRNTST